MSRHLSSRYSIGLDYGTESARALLVNVATGEEAAEAVFPFERGQNGVILTDDPNLARQHPAEYEKAAERLLAGIVRVARRRIRGFQVEQVIGIGVDATGSTPIPLAANGTPLANQPEFAREPAALAWLWKDHTSIAEAEEITDAARRYRPKYLKNCGGTYSSEWYWSKILHCRRAAPRVFDAAYSWVECADWIPALLTGQSAPEAMRIGICAAGHKGLFDARWGGYPEESFLEKIDRNLASLRRRLPATAHTIADACGGLSGAWARRTGLPAGTPVAIGAIDAHLGAIGAGITPGALVKIIGTSTCDMLVADCRAHQPEIPGLCGIVKGSIVPGLHGFEAGQSAVGDIFNWFVREIQPGGPKAGSHAELTRAAAKLKPGASGLLGLDWHNGNRCVLVDPRLTGLLVGQTLRTTPAEIYRALIESTAFGALMIIRRLESCGLGVRRVINCGGIAEKSPLLMQIYADVLGRPMHVAGSPQTCALGAAIAGAVAAGLRRGGYRDVRQAQRFMTRKPSKTYQPDRAAGRIYEKLFSLYEQMHDAFGGRTGSVMLAGVMKRLLEIRDAVRNPTPDPA